MTLSELSVLVTLTTDSGKVLAKLHAVQPTGSINFIQGIKIAHVSNQNQKREQVGAIYLVRKDNHLEGFSMAYLDV